jgi:phenylpropionate dioxygenase-like ring-hydroxylating dioxygenase large terminal subunit
MNPFEQAELRSAREATYPPPYPEAWYVVARSKDVNDDPVQVRVAGHDLVLFRDGGHRLRAVSAYCPHMGANLADGVVRDGCIECPFHRWQIDGEGRVTKMLNGQRPEPRHRTLSWAVEDLHGWACVYHRHGDLTPGPAPKPRYQPERLPEIESGELRYRGEYDAGVVHMHLLEFVENSVDFQHFAPVHGGMRIPWTSIPIPGIRIEHEATWKRDESESHVSWFENRAALSFRGKVIPNSGAVAVVRLEGPGGIVRFDFSLNARPGRIVMFQSHTPVAPLTQRVRFRWFSDQDVSKVQAAFIVGNWVSQWRQDIGIWERKIFRKNPLLSRCDGPVHQLRRWYSQFYPTPRTLGGENRASVSATETRGSALTETSHVRRDADEGLRVSHPPHQK